MTTAKKTTKKTATAKKVAPAKRATAKKVAPAKKAVVAKKATVAKKVVVKKATVAKKVVVKKPVAEPAVVEVPKPRRAAATPRPLVAKVRSRRNVVLPFRERLEEAMHRELGHDGPVCHACRMNGSRLAALAAMPAVVAV